MKKTTTLVIVGYLTIVIGSAFLMHLKNEGDRTVAQVLYAKIKGE